MDAEGHLIKKIARAIPSAGSAKNSSGLWLGIGDDAAIFAPSKGCEMVFSCDAFLEGVHFLVGSHPAESVGYKSLVRASSDLAAMGARPRFFLMTLAIPASRTGAWLDGFLGGMRRAARETGMTLAGGDTTRSRAAVSVSITVAGEVRKGRALKRRGAQPGDSIYVSGKLGLAQLGLELLLHGFGRDGRLRAAIKPHLYPQIRLQLGAWLAERRIASAMMDLSDGLSSDLPRLCEASGVGARIWENRLPCATIPAGVSLNARRKLHLDPLRLALDGGEDYQLLFTVPHRNVQLLKNAPEAKDLHLIGEITSGEGILLGRAGGTFAPIPSRGWDPFRGKT
ncbi:MAG: thiamine-phosphate kinase [Candidatus Acidiferrales bacterium]